MKGKQRSLNGLFWRYLLSTMALLAGVLLALWFVLLQLIRMGAVLPADTGARNLERTTVLLQAQETFDPGKSHSTIAGRWRTVAASWRATCPRKRRPGPRRSSPARSHATDFSTQNTTGRFHCPVGGSVCSSMTTRSATPIPPSRRGCRISSSCSSWSAWGASCWWLSGGPITIPRVCAGTPRPSPWPATGSPSRHWTPPSPAQAQVRELQAALTALDTLRRELAASLQDQWAGEQQKQALLAALAHDLKNAPHHHQRQCGAAGRGQPPPGPAGLCPGHPPGGPQR